ncbi:SMP-30/gluconolactonase/LRE family protein [Lysobacter alkalisoli]|uniref:SMP-30/gluconolactonase/LRE family protein n=2 Tax=Marilutibacter alkalisoli TaxID=2591633 RepID=A0A514BWX0_9GAMM|nr:SMP-30/gluconolactonase/LRE family protein [Lysobacter alkalisoli]
MFPSRALVAALLTMLLLAGCPGPHAVAPSGERLYEASDFVGDGVFTAGIEGPATGADGALYAVNFAREGTIGRVVETADGRGEATLFVELPEGSVGNGIRFDADGFMYVADYTMHRILRIDPSGQSIGTFASLPDAHGPNDIAFAPNGMFYASDPDWSSNSGQLWLVLPYGAVRLLESGMGTTNGIEVSPNGRRLYVNESVQRRVWVYDVDIFSGNIDNKRLLIEFPDHGLDGMRTDFHGNLHIARHGAGEVAIVSPAGELLRTVRLRGRKPSNVAFGGADGRTVYVTLQDRGAIERYRSELPGRETGY